MQSSDIIQPLAIRAPFAVNGDKNIPNYNASGTETSSINLGFLPITSEQLPPDGNGKAPERVDFNGMFYLATDLRVFQQNGGLITYNTNVVNKIGGYPKGAVLAYLTNNGLGFVESCIEDNNQNFITSPSLINGTVWKYTHLFNIDSDIATVNSTITSVNNNLQNQINTHTNSINTLNSTTVKTSGNQTISGQKTFNNAVFVPDSTTNGTAVNLTDQSLGSDGYVKFGNGLLIQWGQHTIGSSSTSTGYITFPVVFLNTSYKFVATHVGGDNSAVSIYSVSERGRSRIYINVGLKQAMTTEWIAVGRWK